MIHLLSAALLLLVAVKLEFSSSPDGCNISVNSHLGNPQTLILKPGQHNGNNAFVWPQKNGIIALNENEVVILACPGGFLYVKNASLNVEFSEATCRSSYFTVKEDSVAFNDIHCSKLPAHTARYSGKNCLQKFKEIEIGFTFTDGKFITDIVVCFDQSEQNSIYSQFIMTKSINGIQNGFPRRNFIQDNFYNLSTSIENLYKRNTQRITVNKLVGISKLSDNYINETNDHFLSKGHLTAKADFVYGSQQMLTFHYVNVAPQWQSFNGGNWNILENDVTDFVGKSQSDITIYTGTYGITTLPHKETGKDTEIWLYVNDNKKGLPVPQIFWKVLYNPAAKTGIAFVGINNPYHSIDYIKSNEIFCNNICNTISWLTWMPTDNTKGYSYCCEVGDLRKTVTSIPKLKVKSLLF